VVSKAEALAWVRLTEPMVGERTGQVQVEFLCLEVEMVDLHRTVLAEPSDVAPRVFPVLV
jgi:hypothetical protein